MDTLSPSATAKVTSAGEPAAAPRFPTTSAADDWFRPCALIALSESSPRLGETVRTLLADDLPCLLVDHSGSPENAALLDELARLPGVHLYRHYAAQGRGAAMLRGLEEAGRLGFSHAAQVDANGRDDLQRVSLFLDRASQAPDAVICSYPRSERGPAGSGVSQWCLTQLSRLSASARTSLCEMRVYPLATTLAHAQSLQLETAPHFDAQLLARMHWQDEPMVWLRVAARASLPGTANDPRFGLLNVLRLVLRAVLGRLRRLR
jgi:hypothetical protein